MYGKMMPIPAEVLAELEVRLNKILFLGVPIGATLNDTFIIYLFNGKIDLGMKETARRTLHGIYRFWLPLFQRKPKKQMIRSRILATHISSDRRLADLMDPIIQAFEGQTSVFGCSRKALPWKVCNYINWRDTSADASKWRREYLSCRRAWKDVLIGWCDEHQVSRRVIPLLMSSLLIESQMIAASLSILESVAPAVIVTEFDRNAGSAPLVLMARKLGIKTVTLVHAAIAKPVGFMPVLADIICCWGEQQKELLCTNGCAESRVRVVGCARLSRTIPELHVEQVMKKLGQSTDRQVITLASNPIRACERLKFVRFFGEAMLRLAGEVVGVVRLHPSERVEFYKEIGREYPHLIFSDNRTLTLDEMMAVSRIVVTHNSGLGNDALVKGRLTIVADVVDVPLLNGHSLACEAGCPCVKSSEELALEIKKILTQERYADALKQQADRYVTRFCAAYGAESTERIVRVIESLCEEKGARGHAQQR